jgi:hypothetical protein
VIVLYLVAGLAAGSIVAWFWVIWYWGILFVFSALNNRCHSSLTSFMLNLGWAVSFHSVKIICNINSLWVNSLW